MTSKEIYENYVNQIQCVYAEDIATDKKGEARPVVKWKKEKEKYRFKGFDERQPVLIECPSDLLAIEFEFNQRTQNEKCIGFVAEECRKKGLQFCIADHGGKSPYIYLRFSDLPKERNKDFKLAIARHIIPRRIFGELDRTNLGATLIPIIGMPHWKPKYNGQEHKILEGPLPNEHANWIKQVLPTYEIDNLKKPIITLTERPLERQAIPGFLLSLIAKGSGPGKRHEKVFVITKELYHLGYDDEGIKILVLKFNSNCNPSKEESIVLHHVENLLEHAESYLGIEKVIETQKSEMLIDSITLMEKELPPLEYFIEPLIPKNTLILVGGRPSSFKSMFTLSLVLAISKGVNYMDQFETNKGQKVLLYDLENGKRVMHRRIKYLINGNAALDKSPFELCFDFDKENIEKEREFASKYDLIILDSYRRFLKGEENSSEITDAFYRYFLKPLRDAGKTIIIIHHFRKTKPENLTDEDVESLFRGSSDLPAQVDLIFGLLKSSEEVENKKSKFTVSVLKCKNRLGLNIRDFIFTVEKDDMYLSTDIKFAKYGYYNPAEEIDTIIINFLENGQKKRKAIVEEIVSKTRVAKATAVRHITGLVAAGMIKSTKFGHYRLEDDDDSNYNPESEENDVIRNTTQKKGDTVIHFLQKGQLEAQKGTKQQKKSVSPTEKSVSVIQFKGGGKAETGSKSVSPYQVDNNNIIYKEYQYYKSYSNNTWNIRECTTCERQVETRKKKDEISGKIHYICKKCDDEVKS